MRTYGILLLILSVYSPKMAWALGYCPTVFSSTSDKLLPKKVEDQFPDLTATQPRILEINKQTIVVHNLTIGDQLKKIVNDLASKNNLALPRLKILFRFLEHKNTFNIDVTPEGYIVAAANGEHSGGYGQFIWYRDLARTITGLSSLKDLRKRFGMAEKNGIEDTIKVSQGMVRLFTEKDQILRTLKVILNPELLNESNPDHYRNGIFIRLGLKGRSKDNKMTFEDKEIESKWGHKQNDALALYGHALLDRIVKGELNSNDLTTEFKAEIIYLVSYLQRINFSMAKDVGAWEENMGVRTSSISLVTSFLERFQEGWSQTQVKANPESEFFNNLKLSWTNGSLNSFTESLVKEHPEILNEKSFSQVKNIIDQSLNELPNAIKASYDVIFPRLGIFRDEASNRVYHKPIEVDEPNNTRKADAALFHLLLYPPKHLTLKDRIAITESLVQDLMGISGIDRYSHDWFMYGAADAVEHASKLPIPPELIARKEGDRFVSTTREVRDDIYQKYWEQQYSKNMTAVEAITGTGLEAQWAIHDPILTQIYSQFYKETHSEIFKEKAWFHLARSLAFITGKNSLSIEGHSIQSYRVPEAWIPVRMINEGEVFTAFFSSPNSPLNWATAELITAFAKFFESIQ